jgi:hypothetical protein
VLCGYLILKKETDGSGSFKKLRIKEPRVPVFLRNKKTPELENRRL